MSTRTWSPTKTKTDSIDGTTYEKTSAGGWILRRTKGYPGATKGWYLIKNEKFYGQCMNIEEANYMISLYENGTIKNSHFENGRMKALQEIQNAGYSTFGPGGFSLKPWEKFDYQRIKKIADSLGISISENEAQAMHNRAKKNSWNDDGWLLNIKKLLKEK
jgi:hypothetical protein